MEWRGRVWGEVEGSGGEVGEVAVVNVEDLDNGFELVANLFSVVGVVLVLVRWVDWEATG